MSKLIAFSDSHVGMCKRFVQITSILRLLIIVIGSIRSAKLVCKEIVEQHIYWSYKMSRSDIPE